MKLERLVVRNVRSHAEYSLDLSPDITQITGQNGAGKTTLLEALYTACQGKSFKPDTGAVLKTGQTWWRIDLVFNDKTVRTVKFDSERETGKKQFTIDDKTFYRLSPKHKLPVILFEPEDLRLLNGSPTRRRRFIDDFIAQTVTGYQTTLNKYDRALKQRNNLLKSGNLSPNELFIWDVALSEYGAEIIEKRSQLIEQINGRLQTAYQSIARTDDKVVVRYSHVGTSSVKQKMMRELNEASKRDQVLGFTSVGPHRHDVIFEFNSRPALSVASRGEVRSVVLALKFIEVDIIKQITNTQPLVLLDDVFSELDEARQAQLIDSFTGLQMVITSVQPVGFFRSIKLD